MRCIARASLGHGMKRSVLLAHPPLLLTLSLPLRPTRRALRPKRRPAFAGGGGKKNMHACIQSGMDLPHSSQLMRQGTKAPTHPPTHQPKPTGSRVPLQDAFPSRPPAPDPAGRAAWVIDERGRAFSFPSPPPPSHLPPPQQQHIEREQQAAHNKVPYTHITTCPL